MTEAGEVTSTRRVPIDGLIALGLGLGALTFHLVTARLALPHDADLPLFGADTARSMRHMAIRGPMLDRAQFHPLFPFLTQPPMRVLEAAGMGRLLAAQTVMATYGGVLAAAVYGTSRRRGLVAWEALAPAVLATVAGASVVFSAIPETFGVSAALAAVIIFVVAGWDGPPRTIEAVGVLVAGGAAVVSGALAPLVAVVRAEPSWARRIRLVAMAAASALVLVAVQFAVFGTRITLTVAGESAFVRDDPVAGALDSLRTLLVSAWAVPGPERAGAGVITVDGAAWTPALLLVAVALAAWWALIAVGVWDRRHDALVPVLLVAIAVHVIGFSFYGDEAFLYAAPLVALVAGLVVVAAASERVRRPLIGLCWALVPVLLVVNVGALAEAGRLLGR